jgi:phosphomannomutase
MLVNDKDGVCASVVFYEMYEELCRKEGRTLLDLISFLRKEYGYWLNYVRYFLCYDPVTIKSLFDGIRNRNYGETIGRFKISGVRDLTVGYDSTTPDKKPVLPVSAASQMITFWTSEPAESVTTLRTSGTEPKIKYYIDVKHTDEETAKSLLQELRQSVINELLEP